MNYDINPKQWRKIFAVPSLVAENYLKIAPAKSVKVILFIAYNNDRIYTPKEISDAVGISEEDAEEGIIFWKNVGVLCDDCTVKELPAPETAEQEPTPLKKQAPAKSTSGKELRPSDIAERITSDNEIRFLFSNAETAFAHILNHTEQRSLIWIHDYLGLSSEIIIMIIEFLKTRDKLTVSVMESTAKDWYEKDITDVRSAEAEIERLNEYQTFEYKIKTIFGIKKRNLSTKEKTIIADWCSRGFSSDLITYAFDKTVDATGDISFAYTNKILLSWEKNGFTTREQVDEADKPKSKEAKPTYSANGAKKKYDFDALKKIPLTSGGKE